MFGDERAILLQGSAPPPTQAASAPVTMPQPRRFLGEAQPFARHGDLSAVADHGAKARHRDRPDELREVGMIVGLRAPPLATQHSLVAAMEPFSGDRRKHLGVLRHQPRAVLDEQAAFAQARLAAVERSAVPLEQQLLGGQPRFGPRQRATVKSALTDRRQDLACHPSLKCAGFWAARVEDQGVEAAFVDEPRGSAPPCRGRPKHHWY